VRVLVCLGTGTATGGVDKSPPNSVLSFLPHALRYAGHVRPIEDMAALHHQNILSSISPEVRHRIACILHALTSIGSYPFECYNINLKQFSFTHLIDVC